MVAPTLVKITLYDPNQNGDAGVPFVGRAGFKPTLQRHIEGETPPDYVVTTKRFFVSFGAALGLNPATPGVAWVLLEPTDYGTYANAWAWEIGFYRPGQADNQCAEVGSYYVPTTGGTLNFGDLIPVDPNLPVVIPPVWEQQIIALQGDVTDLQAEDINLQTQIDNIVGNSVSSVNTETGDVVLTLIPDVAHVGFMTIEAVGT